MKEAKCFSTGNDINGSSAVLTKKSESANFFSGVQPKLKAAGLRESFAFATLLNSWPRSVAIQNSTSVPRTLTPKLFQPLSRKSTGVEAILSEATRIVSRFPSLSKKARSKNEASPCSTTLISPVSLFFSVFGCFALSLKRQVTLKPSAGTAMFSRKRSQDSLTLAST